MTARDDLNGFVGAKGPRTGNDVTRILDRHTFTFSPGVGQAPTFAYDREQSNDRGTAFADEDLRLVFPSGALTFERGRSPDVFLRGAFNSGAATIGALVRRAKGKPSRGGLRGAWHVIVYELSAIAGGTCFCNAPTISTRLMESIPSSASRSWSMPSMSAG